MGISFAFIFSLVVAFKFSKAAPQNSSNGKLMHFLIFLIITTTIIIIYIDKGK